MCFHKVIDGFAFVQHPLERWNGRIDDLTDLSQLRAVLEQRNGVQTLFLHIDPGDLLRKHGLHGVVALAKAQQLLVVRNDFGQFGIQLVFTKRQAYGLQVGQHDVALVLRVEHAIGDPCFCELFHPCSLPTQKPGHRFRVRFPSR